MSENVLITGGTGLVGTHLTQLLLEKGYTVSHLSRSKNHPSSKAKMYLWDVKDNYIDMEAIRQADYVIHLAGANVGESRWTSARKKEILESRTHATHLLISKIKACTEQKIKAFVSASAIGYYGDTADLWVDELSAPAHDFLAEVCHAWEKEVAAIDSTSIRKVIVRIGVVLSNQGGALVEMAKPVRLMAGAALGSGKQYISWIHLDDICRLFVKAIEDPTMEGVYNGVGPHPVTNKDLTQLIAEALGKPLILPNVPAFALRMALGEMADIVLFSCRVNNQKLLDSGFEFRFPSARAAINDLLRK